MEVPDYSIFPDKPVIYASFWQRFLASFIDGLILAVAFFFVKFVLKSGSWQLLLYQAVVRWLYEAFQESGTNMATIGKMTMHIKVTDLDGNRITFGQATGRHFGKYISTLILFIGYFMMLWEERRQTLHDKIAGTIVILDP